MLERYDQVAIIAWGFCFHSFMPSFLFFSFSFSFSFSFLFPYKLFEEMKYHLSTRSPDTDNIQVMS
jgi:hypothetical protein